MNSSEFTHRLLGQTEHLNIYDVPYPECGTVTSTVKMKDDSKTLSRCDEGHEFMQAQVTVNAAKRLLAVSVVPDAYTDAQGREDLVCVQDAFKRKRRKIGVDRNGLIFWWVGSRTLACSTRVGRVVGFVELSHQPDYLSVKNERVFCRSVNATYLLPDYRGRGIILGMYQYLLTQFNLTSDDTQTPEGHGIWKRLQSLGYKVEVLDIYSHGRGKPKTKWGDAHTVLLIRRDK